MNFVKELFIPRLNDDGVGLSGLKRRPAPIRKINKKRPNKEIKLSDLMRRA